MPKTITIPCMKSPYEKAEVSWGADGRPRVCVTKRQGDLASRFVIQFENIQIALHRPTSKTRVTANGIITGKLISIRSFHKSPLRGRLRKRKKSYVKKGYLTKKAKDLLDEKKKFLQRFIK